MMGLLMSSEDSGARLDTHEAVCALRYEGICARLKRLESISLGVAGFIIALLLAIVLKMN